MHCSQVSDLIGKIQKAYVETLEELSWMDSPSKEKAREKVKHTQPSGADTGASLDVPHHHNYCSARRVGHGDQGAHWLSRPYSAGDQPEARPGVRSCK